MKEITVLKWSPLLNYVRSDYCCQQTFSCFDTVFLVLDDVGKGENAFVLPAPLWCFASSWSSVFTTFDTNELDITLKFAAKFTSLLDPRTRSV